MIILRKGGVIMELNKLRERYDDDELLKVKGYLEALELFLTHQGKSFDSCTNLDLENYMESLVSKGLNDLNRIFAIARYFYFYDYNELYLFMTGVLGSIGVISSINDKSRRLGQSVQLEVPEIGLTPKKLYPKTKEFIKEIMQLECRDYREILADNHHQIPRESILKEKKLYDKSVSLELYLKERHQRKVNELQHYCDHKKVWFEQMITQEVVDYVASNQEILSGVYEEGFIYITKFPYNTSQVIHSDSDEMRRYHYCHCPFAKESILTNEPVDSEWCYCSAGFAKFPYEVIFDQPLQVELIESVLKGDSCCRFRIRWEK